MDERYGRLTVVAEQGRNKYGIRQVRCKCDCGNEVVVSESHLRSGDTKSCGCLKRERIATTNLSHGKASTRLYRIWTGMKNRCYNEHCEHYRDYGGRGITICDEWLNNFQAFHDWAVSNGYKRNLTIDRKDNNSSYRPDNCKWSTQKEQSNNTRRSVRVTAFGETHTVAEWARLTGLQDKTIYKRLKAGKRGEEALAKPRTKN